MSKVISNTIILSILVVLITNLIKYQYDRNYHKTYFSQLSVQEQYKELDCLTENVYYEAAGEDLPGKIAVAQLTIQRVESSARSKRFENTICKAVHQGSEFSWVKDKPKKLININKRVYNDSREVAKKVLFEGERLDIINKPNVLYYHADYVTPSWSKEFIHVAKIGKHHYYERHENGKW